MREKDQMLHFRVSKAELEIRGLRKYPERLLHIFAKKDSPADTTIRGRNNILSGSFTRVNIGDALLLSVL